MSDSNPLSKFFRQPKMYVTLPSDGKWYSTESIEIPVTKEFPVFSMTAKDELSLQTPDALLNGQSTVDVIQSCIPNIKNAWDMPSIDVDPALISIRRATYGDRMDFVSVCPHCNRKNEHSLNLEFLASKFTKPEFDDVVSIEDLEIFIKPQTYRQLNKANIEKYEHQRLLQVVADKDISTEVKQQEYKNIFYKLLDLTVEQIAHSVVAIRLKDRTVIDNRQHIDEFMKNCNKTVWNTVKDRILKINETNPLKNIDLQCEQEDCEKPYSSPLIFEHSNFFG